MAGIFTQLFQDIVRLHNATVNSVTLKDLNVNFK